MKRAIEFTEAEIFRLLQAVDTQILDLTGSGASTPKALMTALEKLQAAHPKRKSRR